MDFISDLDILKTQLEGIQIREDELTQLIVQCKKFAQKYLGIESKSARFLNKISTEPTGSYYPEMYQKVKQDALEKCKDEIADFIKQCTVEFNTLALEYVFEDLIKLEESQTLEFKSTLCWDIKKAQADKKLMGEIIMKSISAFSNSEGGVLLIGIDDDKNILGLGNDYQVFKDGKGTKDDFELHLTTLVINNFSKTFAKENIKIEFPQIGDREICLIRIQKGIHPYTILISEKNSQPKEKFFIRVNNSSRDIDKLLELARYIKQRFPLWN